MSKKRLGGNGILAAIVAVLLVLVLAINVLAFGIFKVTLNNFFTKFETTDTSVMTTQEDWYNIASKIEEEAIVLLKNDNDTLPLEGVEKINLLGYRSYNHVYGGTGSGATDSSNAVTLSAGLANVGITANPALTEQGIYTVSFNDDTEGMGLFGRFMGAGYDLTTEPDISMFTDACSFENLKNYSDVAIVTLGRIGGEGSDLTSAPADKLDGASHFLELSDSEKELLQTARDTFETLIVLVNSGNSMELGCLEDYDVDAALWVGDVGCRGMEAVAKVLAGEVNPSGRLADTYAYDATSAPSYANFGDFTFANYEENYVNYAEGIYVGYKWYETADAEGFFDNVSNEYGTGYDGVVQFPFGYGLSYTEFEQHISGGTSDGSKLNKDTEISIEVTVENIGDVAGKEVVELYYTAPYTNGGLEKAAINLLNYDKTEILEANGKETVTFSFLAEDMASYDTSANAGNGAYVLEKGEYVVSICADSHTVLDSVTFVVDSDIVYSDSEAGARTTDEQAAVNQFEDCDNGMLYLSRSNHFENFDEVLNQTANVASEETIYEIENYAVYDESYDAISVEYVEGVDYRAEGEYVKQEGDLTLSDMKGLSYDAEEWTQLLSQMSISDMKKLVGEGGWSTAEIASVGKALETHIDSGAGLVRVVGATPILGTAYPSGVVQASTWNKELIIEFAEHYGDEAHNTGVSGIYAPSTNIHRSPFGGRNYEYCSEDPVLSGYTAASFTQGFKNKGVLCYMKHFALNEQETNRNSTCTYANEQSIREIYLKPYEITVKVAEIMGTMSSMNRIGATWAGAHEGLLTEVLKGEWGYQGFVITDACEVDYMLTIDRGLRAGNDMWLSGTAVEATVKTDADIYYLQRACKNILYAEANADVVEAEIVPWQTYVVIVDAALGAIILVCIALMIRNIRRNKRSVIDLKED